MFKRLGFVALLALAVASTIELGGQLIMHGEVGFVSRAEAIVGRPLTPVSYAGVARRTVRRCAAYC
jgi:hypothetical protein